MDFTYESYKHLVEDIRAMGYTFTDYHSYRNVSRPCIFRHDIDTDISQALRLAEYEANMAGEPVHSTYFVLVSSDFYNVFSKGNEQQLKQILALGHEIGLHFDEKKYMDEETFNRDILIESVYKESKLLSDILGVPVQCVSMHRPSKRFLEEDFTFKGLVNSYSNEFFHSFKYLSDSRHHWRENVTEIVNSGKEPALHILTHPFWYHEEPVSMHDCLHEFTKSAVVGRYRNLADNIRDLDQVLTYEELV